MLKVFLVSDKIGLLEETQFFLYHFKKFFLEKFVRLTNMILKCSVRLENFMDHCSQIKAIIK
jgi:hypothetical protein